MTIDSSECSKAIDEKKELLSKQIYGKKQCTPQTQKVSELVLTMFAILSLSETQGENENNLKTLEKYYPKTSKNDEIKDFFERLQKNEYVFDKNGITTQGKTVFNTLVSRLNTDDIMTIINNDLRKERKRGCSIIGGKEPVSKIPATNNDWRTEAKANGQVRTF